MLKDIKVENIYIVCGRTDMRKSISGLAEIIQQQFELDLFSDTDKGADASAVFMSIIETAKRNNLDVYGYLLYLLNRLASYGRTPTKTQLSSLSPWSISLPAYCRAKYNELM